MFHNKVFSLNEDQSLLDGMSRKHVFKMTVDPSCDSFSSRGKKQIVVFQHLIKLRAWAQSAPAIT